ncbi:MAG: histidine kinase dimerization/phosphoacceptor domain -containing protein [Bacteroidota bacterium]
MGLVLLFIKSNLNAQESFEKKFLVYFNSQSLAGKVNAFDTLHNDFKASCYPLVKAELKKIREQAIIDHQDAILDKFIKIEAEMFYIYKNYSKAIPLFTDLLAKRKVKGYKDSASVLYCLKNSYIKLHSLNKAIEIHRILMHLKKSHSDINAWMFHPKLSIIYYEMKMYKECLNQQLLEFDEVKQYPHMLLGYYNNRGLFWQRLGIMDSALTCFNKAKEIFNEMHPDKTVLNINDEFVIGLIEGNIGQVYIELQQYEKAIPLLEKDIIASMNVGDTLNAAVSEIELARCYLNLNQPHLSKKYLDGANAKLTRIEDYKTHLNIIKQYAIYYDKVGLYRMSIDQYNKYLKFKDSMDYQENLKELISSQVASQVAEKENLIIESQKNIREKNSEVSKQKTIKNALLFCGLILIVVVVFISYQLKNIKTQKQLLEIKNKQIETRNEIIDKSLSEKDLLIKEVHHRVKNNLQIISSLMKLQSAKTNNPEIQNSLGEAQDRINSMALLHQLLYRNNQMTSLPFGEYLRSLINQISGSFSLLKKNITIETNFIDLELDLDTAIPLGLITNELVSNAFKHAFKGKNGVIRVELSKLVKNTYQLKVSDNGQGLAANFDLSSMDSLGLDIVAILSEQINAELKIYNDNGAHFDIVFKVG